MPKAANPRGAAARALCLSLSLSLTPLAAQAQKRRAPAAQPAKPRAARLIVEGTYEEIYKGGAQDGSRLDSDLKVQFNASRWLRMGESETGRAEFTDLPNAPAPAASGVVTLEASFTGKDLLATRSFSGKLDDPAVVTLGAPEFADTGDGLKLNVFLHPRLKGKCLLRAGDTTSDECEGNPAGQTTRTFNFSANEDVDRTAETKYKADFESVLTVEPAVGQPGEVAGASGVDEAARLRRQLAQQMGQAGDSGDTWYGAVTRGSKEAGYKISIAETKETPGADGQSSLKRKLTLEASIVPGGPPVAGHFGGRVEDLPAHAAEAEERVDLRALLAGSKQS